MENDREREVRLRPPKPVVRRERAAWIPALRIMMHYARMSRLARRRSIGHASRTSRIRPYQQRCAIRVTYSKNTTRGQWRAHGRYLARDSATQEQSAKEVGFDGRTERIDIASTLAAWQKHRDERLWKIIISPEFGERIDLQRLTRELLAKMEKDLGTPLEWVAVAHFNTEHPHVHVALRGIGTDGKEVRLNRDYIKQGIRERAEDLCTLQIGYRTEFDAAEAQRREVRECRYTSLDRAIQRDSKPASQPSTIMITKEPNRDNLMDQYVRERLMVLETLGLSERAHPSMGHVRSDFERVLRAMQRTVDRQKTLAAHGVPVSDERLPMAVVDPHRLTTLEGRVLVHGEEESSGRSYFMLEGTDGRIHHIYYRPEIEEARSHGKLRTNSFIRLRKVPARGHPTVEIDDFGDSEAILRNKRFLLDTARRLIRRGVLPQEDGWHGWLGRYQQAVKNAAILERQRSAAGEKDRRRNRDRGR